MGEHLTDEGEFKSDKYAWSPPGFFPMKLSDRVAQTCILLYAAMTHDVDLGLDLVAAVYAVKPDAKTHSLPMALAVEEIHSLRLELKAAYDVIEALPAEAMDRVPSSKFFQSLKAMTAAEKRRGFQTYLDRLTKERDDLKAEVKGLKR